MGPALPGLGAPKRRTVRYWRGFGRINRRHLPRMRPTGHLPPVACRRRGHVRFEGSRRRLLRRTLVEDPLLCARQRRANL